jgi:nucleotide-binding universal stress UspA family protein
MVPVKGHTVDEQAARLASLVARQEKAKLLIFHVLEIRRAVPLETEDPARIEHGEKILENADRAARAMGVVPYTELLQARTVAPTLMQEAAERQVDLIIMGVPYRQPLDEFYLGSTVRYVLKNAACKVWLCRQEEVEETGPKK